MFSSSHSWKVCPFLLVGLGPSVVVSTTTATFWYATVMWFLHLLQIVLPCVWKSRVICLSFIISGSAASHLSFKYTECWESAEKQGCPYHTFQTKFLDDYIEVRKKMFFVCFFSVVLLKLVGWPPSCAHLKPAAWGICVPFHTFHVTVFEILFEFWKLSSIFLWKLFCLQTKSWMVSQKLNRKSAKWRPYQMSWILYTYFPL